MKLLQGINRAFVTGSKCNNCGLCAKVCPGTFLNFNELNEFVFGKIPDDVSLGNYIGCYIGHSSVEKIWSEAPSSGGVVTGLLIFALEKGIIDGALVTRMNHNNPLEPETFIARNKEDILSAAGSKYCPVSANSGIKTILKSEGKFAVVGLPCHIQGIRKAELLNNTLKEKIVLHIGLFCSHVNSFLATQCLLERMGVAPSNVANLEYRTGGWPGNLTLSLKNSSDVSIPYSHYWDCIFGSFFFTPVACTLCTDPTNELSDISVGDPWSPGGKNLKKGLTTIIARTEWGKKLLVSAWSNNQIELMHLDCNAVKQSQKFNLAFKKKTIGIRATILQQFGKRKPMVIPQPKSSACSAYLAALLPLVSIYLSSFQRFRWVLKYTPYPLLQFYFRLSSVTLLLV